MESNSKSLNKPPAKSLNKPPSKSQVESLNNRCAAPDCDQFVNGKIHCQIHYTKFRKAHECYKKEQFKIQKYINDPSLLDKLPANKLIRVAGISLQVCEMRRDQSKMGFKEELHDIGHKKMIEQLLSLSIRASQKLTIMFNLPAITKDMAPSAESSTTVDDDGYQCDPLEVVRLLKLERDEMIKAELAKKKQESIETNTMLTRLSDDKKRLMHDAEYALATFMGLCNTLMIAKRCKCCLKIEVDNSQGIWWIVDEDRLELTIDNEREPGKKIMAQTKNGGLSRLFEKCYIDQDFEDFYQKDINLSQELSKLTLRDAKAVVDKFYKDGPHNGFVVVCQTPRVCLKFLAFGTKNTRIQLRGEWIVKLRYCPHKSKLNVSLKYLEYVLVDKRGKITYIESITD